MQNKTAIWVFTVLLTFACVYQLAFSWVTSNMEKEANDFATTKIDSVQQESPEEFEDYQLDSLHELYKVQYLDRNGDREVYPIFGHTYDESKRRALSLGLDLQGGMSVTLQVDVPRLIMNMADNPKDPAFREALKEADRQHLDEGAEFFEVFLSEFEDRAPEAKLAAIVHSRRNRTLFPSDASNEEIVQTMREKRNEAVENTERILRERIDKFGVTNPRIQKQGLTGRIIVELPGVKDKDRVREYLRSTANLEFWETYGNREIYSNLERADRELRKVLHPDMEEDGDTALDGEETDDTLDTEGVEEDEAVSDTDGTDTAEGEDGILEDLREGSDTMDEESQQELADREEFRKQNPLFSVLRPNVRQDPETGGTELVEGPVVGIARGTDTSEVNRLLNRSEAQAAFPSDLRFMWGAEPQQGNVFALYAIRVTKRSGEAPLDGERVVDASQEFDRDGNVQVVMQMDGEGAEIWRNLTKENVGSAVSIVMDNEVYSAPIVQDEIPSGRSTITMGGRDRAEDMVEAKDLANLLKAGSLPAPLLIVDEAVVGPSLGEANINSGLLSFAIALSVIIVYMVAYYHGAGIVTDITLIANLFFLIGALASLQASLTLPGIAGIVLTIGIAVDANVLIFDRIREELRKGKALNPAISDGYRKAYAAIVDANITTLLTAIILATFGSGPIRGFATTLIIGIFTSLFAAIFLTRLIFTARLDRKKNIKFATAWTKNAFTNMKVAFLSKRKIAYGFSTIVILVGLFSFFTKGFNMGVEFTGGRTYKVRFIGNASVEQIRSTLGDRFVNEEGIKLPPEVKTFGGGNQVKITTKYRIDDESEDVDEEIEEKVIAGMGSIAEDPRIIGSRKVDPTISKDIKVSAFWAVVFSLVVIFLYILMRFRAWQFGLGALLAMFHDVLVVLACFSLLYGLLPFTLEIDQAFIAAILTVVGYSINDTVVVYDRVREYLREHHKKDPLKVIDMAMNSTIGRTFNTSMTTFLVLLMIFLLGSETIRGFAFALMVGVVVGTYSSLFIATPSTVDLTKKYRKSAVEKKAA